MRTQSLKQMYVNSLLADASYVDYHVGQKKKFETNLSVRMTPMQAKFITDNFEVLTSHHADDSKGSGFDVTVWKGKSPEFKNEIYISFRGTESSVADWVNDGMLIASAAHSQIIDMANWWRKVASKKDRLVDNISITTTPHIIPTTGITKYVETKEVISVKATGELYDYFHNHPDKSNIKIYVNGHSLGGHLASAFVRLFGSDLENMFLFGHNGLLRYIKNISTFNSAGFASTDSEFSTTNAFFEEIERLLKLETTDFGFVSEIQDNFFAANGINFTTNEMYFDQVGNRVPTFNEQSLNHVANHYIYKLTDTLALGNLFYKLDNTVNLEKLNHILLSYQDSKGDALEKTLDALRKIILKKDIVPTQIGDIDGNAPSRIDFYKNLTDKDLDVQGLNIQVMSFSNIHTHDIAVRYALKELNPFAVFNADYSKWNTMNELNLYYPTNNKFGMTQKYLTDRTKMLLWKNLFGLLNLDYSKELDFKEAEFLLSKSLVSQYLSLYPMRDDIRKILSSRPNDGDWVFEDKTLNIKLKIDSKVVTDVINRYAIFGSDKVDDLGGGSLSDNLYGGKGNDTLDGKGGNDYLEGGLDYDTYHIDGKDTILDADMRGQVLLKGVKQTWFVENNNTTWTSLDKSTIATRVNSDLVISQGNNEATIKDYFSLATKIGGNLWNGLDIWLYNNTSFQMLPNKKDKINKYTIFTENNVIIDGSSKADLISANNAGRMIVKTGDGNDVVVSGYKADMIEGGAGNDVLVGSEPVSARDGSLDHDELVGGDGRDLVFGGDGNDVIHAGNRSEHLSVQAINEFGDIVIGGAGNDVVYGGVRNDFVQGGEGKDTLWGGAGMDILLGDGYIRPFNKFTPVATSATPKFKPLPLDAVGSPTAVAEAAISAIANSSLAVEFKLDNKQTNPLQFAELKGVGLLDDKISNWTFSINTNTGDYSFSKTGNELRRNFHVVEADNKRDDGDTLYGGAGNDLVIGQRGNDMLYGDIGNDILWGDDNRDKTISGSDVLDGGAGLDNLYGGLGADTFVFKKADVKAGEADIIHDAEQIDKLIFDNKQLNLEKWNLLAGKSNLWENATKNLQLELNGKDLTLSQVLNNQKTAIAVVKNFDSGDLGLNLPTKAAVSSRSAEYSYANTETITPYYHESNQYI